MANALAGEAQKKTDLRSHSNICKLFPNFKIGAGSSDQLFSVHFFVRNMEKIVPPTKKNGVF